MLWGLEEDPRNVLVKIENKNTNNLKVQCLFKEHFSIQVLPFQSQGVLIPHCQSPNKQFM